MDQPVLTVEELTRLLTMEFPQAFNASSGLTIEELRPGGCRVRQAFEPNALRPGGTISGPAMMLLADVAMYVALLGAIGWVPLAVTTQLNIHFLRKPGPRALVADCDLLRIGRQLAIGKVAIRTDGEADLVAHATSTYSIPRNREV